MPQYFRVVGCLAFATFVASGQSAAPPLGVFMDFDSAPGIASVDAMKREADQLLKPSGLSLAWRLTKENQGDEAFWGLVVLKFKGRCKAELAISPLDELSNAGETRELAATEVSGGRVLPYTEVRCDELRKALAYLSAGANQKERQEALGRAMGRVVAHEIYHIVAKTTAHASQGLAKATQSLEDLVSTKRMAFLDRDSAALARGISAR